jgi:hypothetical protein
MQDLLEWFRVKEADDKNEPTQLALAFSGIAEFLTFESEQLA